MMTRLLNNSIEIVYCTTYDFITVYRKKVQTELGGFLTVKGVLQYYFKDLFLFSKFKKF